MTASGPRWDDTLHAFSEHLARQQAAIEAGRHHDVHEFVPPTGLGPLPPELGPRARDLWQRSHQLEEELEAAILRSTRAAALVRRVQGDATSRPVASFVDRAL